MSTEASIASALSFPIECFSRNWSCACFVLCHFEMCWKLSMYQGTSAASESSPSWARSSAPGSSSSTSRALAHFSAAGSFPFQGRLGLAATLATDLSSLLLGVLVPIRSTQVAVRSAVVESHRAAEVRRHAFTTNAVHAISRKVVRRLRN
jgi:hypothetical protein